MRHIRVLLIAAVLCVGRVWGCPDEVPATGAAAGQLQVQRPNILLIISEDNGPQLSCYGDPFVRTPHLDRLAAEGLRFQRAFVAQAGCSQSRASLLTGLYPHQHGQIGLATWGFRMYRPDLPTLPGLLRAAGYRTGIIGKLHVNPESAFPFDFSRIPVANFQRRNLGDYARSASEFLSTDKDRPFLLQVNFPEAHDPFLTQVDGLPQQPLSAADVRCLPEAGLDPPGLRPIVADYYNCLMRLDSLVGDLLEVLEGSGRASETMVIYLGDHGADLLRGKRTSFEGGLRIPLLIRWPGRVVPQVRDELVTSVDLLPTILQAVDQDIPAGLAGRPLQPLFRPEVVRWRTMLFSEYHTHAAASNYYPQRAVRTDRWKLIENLLPEEVHPDYDVTFRKLSKEAERRKIPGGLDLHAEVSGAAPNVRTAYARMRRPGRFELYDLQTDPHEFCDLSTAPEHAETLRSLQQSLLQWRQETGDPLLLAENLRRLTAEVRAVQDKSEGRQLVWGYPEYFFGREPAAAGDLPKTQTVRKKKRLP